MSPRKAVQLEPQIVQMQHQRMAVVRTVGDPSAVGQQVFPALYGSVYSLKFTRKKAGNDFKVGAPRARWPGPFDAPREQWVGIWGLPIPEDVTSLPQKAPGVEVVVETWEYGTVAQVLHIGLYSEEGPSFQRLHAFIAEQGYEIAGVHEEEYLSRPGAKTQKTLIRYPVRKR